MNLSVSAEKQKRGLYKRGDIVTILSDGHEYGDKETLPNFVILQVPGVSIDFMRRYIQTERGRGQRIQASVPEARRGDVSRFLGIDAADFCDSVETGGVVNGLVPVDAYLFANITRRLFRVLLDELPVRVQAELSILGKSSVTFLEIQLHIENKTTRETEILRAEP